LRCPRCERDLEPGPATWSLLCSSGHSFDANKRGYLNLVDRGRGILGDSRQILDDRARFLALGHYSPIVDLLDAVLPGAAGLSIVDSGCGTGYYLTELLARRDHWQALALDVSAEAVAMAVRATGGAAAGVVSDVWQPLPVRDARADVLLCVFAPRNAAEFARVLTPEGRLVVATPGENHLVELRESGRLIGIQRDKLAHLDEGLAAQFVLDERRAVEYTVDLLPHEVQSLAGMGPSGHHAAAEGRDAQTPQAAEQTRVTVAVDVSSYRRA